MTRQRDRIADLSSQLFGHEADVEMVRVKDDTSEPVTARALAEGIAQCCLEFMRVCPSATLILSSGLTTMGSQQRSGDLDSKNPTIDDISFQQLYLIALHSTDGVNWRVVVQ